MKTSNAGIELIKSFEGLRLKAYQDVVGIWTIGFGSTGSEIVKGLEWTEAQCIDRLRQDLVKFETGIESVLKKPITQNQFDAFVCFTYNCGIGAFKGSTMLKKFNSGDATVGEEFLKWNKAGGKEVPGLTRRRKAEQALFLKPEVESNRTESVLPNGPSESDMNDAFNKIEKGLIK